MSNLAVQFWCAVALVAFIAPLAVLAIRYAVAVSRRPRLRMVMVTPPSTRPSPTLPSVHA